jgi:hypothetical protein
MKYTQIVIGALCTLILATALWIVPAEAQVQGEWSQPYRLSTGTGKASEASLATDAYGYVHAFWPEFLSEDQSAAVFYSRFDGGGWTTALDLYRSKDAATIQSLTSTVDQRGMVHLAWSGGENGPIFYMHTPAAGTLSAQHWQEPLRVDLPGKQVKLLVDPKGALHLLYSRVSGQARGVYYSRSQDQGANWSEPVWLDPDSLPGYFAGSLQFQIDEYDGLHAAWFYAGFETQGADWVRYAHSLDGGDTWSLPFTIDRLIEGSDSTLDFAYPIMAVTGRTVHIVWAGGGLHFRNHRFSTDSGQTWSPPARIFGNLNGQAFEGLTTDGMGRIHYLGHIRNPMGIYHSIWDEGRWTRPSLVYLVSLGEADPIGDRVHAHYTLSTVRAGNQLVLTFTDSPPEPERRLFAIYRTLEDVAPQPAELTPTPTVTPAASPTAVRTAVTPAATPPPAAAMEAVASLPRGGVTRPDQAIWLGMILPLLLMGSTVAFWVLNRYRKESAGKS